MNRGLNAQEVLDNVRELKEELQAVVDNGMYGDLWNVDRHKRVGYSYPSTARCIRFKMRGVCKELSIFDWWNDTLSMNQLRQMETFLTQAIALGFTGYVCFKVGSVGCSHGMWAHTEQSTDGYSPKEGDCLYHSFVSDENYFKIEQGGEWSRAMNLKQVKEALKK